MSTGHLQSVASPANRRRRRHHRAIEHSDRRLLERDGWRTLLDYRENHVRDRDGTLLAVVPQWTGEAELDLAAGAPARRLSTLVATVTAATQDAVWAQLRQVTAGLIRDRAAL